ncbi:salicylate hydroxylase [Hyaloscypha hepaticicola]|uniref:Salicylate hydroxylase n=1 Tax=Hyaloscypha hepaticicola TaxID=2082293 RepID=A0A2J6PUN5_9HELO|nr:salicylate hydroxylase [Hyaloscypha hepaticicola]
MPSAIPELFAWLSSAVDGVKTNLSPGFRGLSSAIALSKLPSVEVTNYEQARELREIGAGIQISYNCWKVLELLGAAAAVKGHVQETIIHRNCITGEALKKQNFSSADPQYRGQRVRRTRLQAALIAKIPRVIKLRKRLISLTNIEEGGVNLVFEDGEEVVADLVIGGDGIRSVVRQSVFSGHAIQLTGRTIWRVIIPKSLIIDIPIMTSSTAWWHGLAGHFYNCLVDDPSETPEEEQIFEIAVHNVVPAASVKEKRFSWGIPATNEIVESHFTEYDPRVRQYGLWKEFSSFAGPRLEKVTAWDKVVLIGDASHPLTGAFGSGAAFAMQDNWFLAQAIGHTRMSRQPLASALAIFDSIRSPYYKKMYEHLDTQTKRVQDAKANNLKQSFEEMLQLKIKGLSGGDLSWIYQNYIQTVWEEYLGAEKNA